MDKEEERKIFSKLLEKIPVRKPKEELLNEKLELELKKDGKERKIEDVNIVIKKSKLENIVENNEVKKKGEFPLCQRDKVHEHISLARGRGLEILVMYNDVILSVREILLTRRIPLLGGGVY